ncbi:hypothetical protein AMTRI_Chr09g18950 [Amborella trichopoda]
MRRGDLAWQYGTKVSDKGRVRCNFCNKKMGGGIYCLKEHLAWVEGNVTSCNEVPLEVKQQMLKLITEGKRNKVQRERDEEDKEAEFKTQIERAKIVSLQNLNYIQMKIQEMYGRRDGASSSRQPQEHVVPDRGGCEPSLPRSTFSRLRRSFSSRPSAYINFASSDFYPQMVASIAEAGPVVRDPTVKELAGPCLEAVAHDVDKHIAQFKVCWSGTGVTIMTDDWKDKSHRYLINFLKSCPRGIKETYWELICVHLDKIVDEVGLENVVQVLTDNAANYIKASLLLMERRPNLYWTPCTAHYVNLMLKKIGKLKRVKTCILKCKLITRFMYNHTYLHALMRKHCMREIVRESSTRFATTFWARCNNVVSITEPLVRVLRLVDCDDKPAMGFLFDAMRCAREAIFENNIWTEEILEVFDRFFLNPQNLYFNATLDNANIMEGVGNCTYRFEPNLETQMELQWWTIHRIQTKQLQKIAVRVLNQTYRHIRRTPTYYTLINLNLIFQRDLADEGVSQRTVLLDQDFPSEAVANMDDNADVTTPNEGDMAVDMDTGYDDYAQDEDEAQDNEETDGTMENDWQGPVVQKCERAQHDALIRLTTPVSPVPFQTAPNPMSG